MSDFKRVKAVQKFFKISQRDFSVTIGVSQSHLSKMLSGQGSVPTESVARMVKAYNVDPNWLLGLIGDDETVMFNQPAVPEAEVERLRRETEEVRQKLYQKTEENAGLYRTISELQAEKIDRLKNNQNLPAG